MSFKTFLKALIFILLILVSLSSKSVASEGAPKDAVAIKLTHRLESGDSARVKVEYLDSQSRVIGLVGDYESRAHKIKTLMMTESRVTYYDEAEAYSVLGFGTKLQGSDITVEITGYSFRARLADYRVVDSGPFLSLSCYDIDNSDCVVIDPKGKMFVPATTFCSVLECQFLAVQTDPVFNFKNDPVAIKLPKNQGGVGRKSEDTVPKDIKSVSRPEAEPQKPTDPPISPALSGATTNAVVSSAIYQAQYPNGCVDTKRLDQLARDFFKDPEDPFGGLKGATIPTPSNVRSLALIAGALAITSIALLAIGSVVSKVPYPPLIAAGLVFMGLGLVTGVVAASTKPTVAAPPPREQSVLVSSRDTESYIAEIPDLENAVQNGYLTEDIIRYAASATGGTDELHKIIRKFGPKAVQLIAHLKGMGFEIGRNIQRADFSNIVQQFGTDFALDLVCGHGANSLNVLKHFARDESKVSKGGALMLIEEFGKDLEGAEGQAVLKDISEKTPELTGGEISLFIESEGGISGAAEAMGVAVKSTVQQATESVEIVAGKFTANNYRKALLKFTGKTVEEMKGIDAHHIFLQKYRSEFAEIGIDIDDPRFLSWWEKGDHRRMASEYGNIWKKFFTDIDGLSAERARDLALEKAVVLADEYHFEIHWR